MLHRRNERDGDEASRRLRTCRDGKAQPRRPPVGRRVFRRMLAVPPTHLAAHGSGVRVVAAAVPLQMRSADTQADLCLHQAKEPRMPETLAYSSVLENTRMQTRL